MKFILRLFDSLFWSLVRKEINQYLRNKQLIILLLIPPTIQLFIYGVALNPDVHNLRLGVVDYANVAQSRELMMAMTSNGVFTLESVLLSEKELSRQVEEGKLDVGIIIPPEFPRQLAKKSASIQVANKNNNHYYTERRRSPPLSSSLFVIRLSIKFLLFST